MDYIPVFILLLVAAVLGCVIMFASWLLGPKIPGRRKNMPFECGVPPLGSSRHRFSVRFYLVAILFLLFDVEAVFFFPFAVVFKRYIQVNHFILLEMGLFVAILLVGYWYVLRKGALEWE
ncbi:MAG: NADH-quinone oxidoreductase subunit A [Oligoflexia bacterium]|nr:NADH-quinone oxidoreductase subunit A [Oligoflexia bacterium]